MVVTGSMVRPVIFTSEPQGPEAETLRRFKDYSFDGTLKYTNQDNDRDPILQNIGGVMHTNVRVDQVP